MRLNRPNRLLNDHSLHLYLTHSFLLFCQHMAPRLIDTDSMHEAPYSTWLAGLKYMKSLSVMREYFTTIEIDAIEMPPYDYLEHKKKLLLPSQRSPLNIIWMLMLEIHLQFSLPRCVACQTSEIASCLFAKSSPIQSHARFFLLYSDSNRVLGLSLRCPLHFFRSSSAFFHFLLASNPPCIF